MIKMYIASGHIINYAASHGNNRIIGDNSAMFLSCIRKRRQILPFLNLHFVSLAVASMEHRPTKVQRVIYL